MYQFGELINHGVFFRFDRKWVQNMNWGLLPKPSKGILPVIACHCNEAGESFPSEQTIAVLSGWTEKKVREGIKGLAGFPGFEVSHYVTKRGRRAKKYRMTFPVKREVGRAFFFHRIIVDGGNWRELKPASQALYPVMRYFSHFDDETYTLEKDDDSLYDAEVPELYKGREWDACEAEISVMATYAGLSRASVYSALVNLEKNYLVEDAGTNDDGARWWKVFVAPLKYWKRDYLNNKVARQGKNDV